MSLFQKHTTRKILCSAIILTIAWIAPALGTSVDNCPSQTFSCVDSWAEGVDYLQHGKYAEANSLFQKLAKQTPQPSKASAWIQEWLQQEKERQELTQADEQDYVKRAKKWFGKDNINRALKWTYWAMLNTVDEKGFLTQPWVLEIKAKALSESDKLFKEHEWRDAHAIYYALSLIFEDDKQVDKRREECLEHARLDELYKDDNNWEETLEGIDPNMVEEALWRTDQKHVVQADFRKLTISGFEELLLIAESPTLQAKFDGLTGERGKSFVARIKRRLEQVRSQGSLTYREALQHFRRALTINRQTAQLPEGIIVKEYTNAALGELDEFSSMIWPYEYREFEKHTRGDFIGVGIQIRNKYNTDLKETEILVVSPLEGSPAYRAGIQAEDVITKVNGKSLTGIRVTKAVDMITGPRGSTVNLTVRRPARDGGQEEEIQFALKREQINIHSVKGVKRLPNNEEHWDFMLDKDMGISYIRILSFQENTVEQLEQALNEAKAQGMQGLVLDLRYNPGGLLKSAVEMAELFLKSGDRIVSTKGLRSQEWAANATKNGAFKDLPLIVLVNDSSASASEIVSGAIKDHHRGLIIGERSFGKFSVQNLIQLMHSEAHLKLTTARYYLPSGKSLHREEGSTKWGVEPEITVSLVPKEENKILFMRRDADVIGAVKTSSEEEMDEPLGPENDDQGDTADNENAEKKKDADEDKDKTEEEEEDPDPNERPDRDPQLETAKLVMRLHLLEQSPIQVAGAVPQKDNKVTNE